MRRTLFHLLVSLAPALLVATDVAAEMRLDGINILGSSKSAYISVDGQRSRFREGDSMNGWTLERVMPRSVELRTPSGELRTLTLRGVGDDTAPGEGQPAAKKKVAEKKPKAEPKPAKPAGSEYSPRVIDDRDVPPGHRKVRTPFGDMLVDESKQKGTLLDR